MLDTITSLLGAATSGVAGGITGLLGIWASNHFEAKKQAETHRHDEVMADKTTEQVRYEADARVNVATIEQATRMDEGANALQAASYAADRAQYITEKMMNSMTGGWGTFVKVMFGILDYSRGMVRIVMSIYAIYIVNKMLTAGLIAWEAMPAKEAAELGTYSLHACIYIAMTTWLWWFGTRPRRKAQ